MANETSDPQTPEYRERITKAVLENVKREHQSCYEVRTGFGMRMVSERHVALAALDGLRGVVEAAFFEAELGRVLEVVHEKGEGALKGALERLHESLTDRLIRDEFGQGYSDQMRKALAHERRSAAVELNHKVVRWMATLS